MVRLSLPLRETVSQFAVALRQAQGERLSTSVHKFTNVFFSMLPRGLDPLRPV